MSPDLMNLVFRVVMTMAGLIVIGAVIAVIVAGVAMLLTIGGGAVTAWKAWRTLHAQPSPCSTAPVEPTPTWSDDDLALASLSDLARQSHGPARPPTLAAGTEMRLSANELVLDMLRTLAADDQRVPQAQMGL
jgi:hypothetical protein